MTQKFKIPIYQPYLNGNEKKYVNDCLDSNWISSKGKYIPKFENSFCDYLGVKHATSVTNGTAALHLALVTLGIGKGDEVIVPSFTYIASVSSIVYTGATPVFVDSLETTWQMNPEDVQRKITKNTKAIMVVHLYGHPCEMDAINILAKRHNLLLIEDCAESFGAKYKNQFTGTFGDIACFSFYGNKVITSGEGGMLITNNKDLYDKAYHFKMHGLTKKKEYWHDVIGFNYRMTNICAAIGLAQIENADSKIKAKRDLIRKYIENIDGIPIDFHREAGNVFHSYWMFSILVKPCDDRDDLRNILKRNGIETRPTFYPVHTMKMFSGLHSRFPIAEDICRRGINLPSYPELEDDKIEYICNIIRKYFKM